VTVAASRAASVPLVACLLLAAWLAWSLVLDDGAGLAGATYLLLNFIVYSDAADFAIRRYVHRRRVAARSATARDAYANVSIDLAALEGGVSAQGDWPRPYAIIASVYNLAGGLDAFVSAFAPYRDHVWLISDGSVDATVPLLRQAGFRCTDDGINRRKPAALRRLLATLPRAIETVMVVDPDVRIRPRGQGSTVPLDRVICDFQRSGAGALAPRIMIEPDGFLGRFQAYEYALSCNVGRLSLGTFGVTSGISLYRREALERVLERHSLSVYAEDLENAILLLQDGENVYYDGRLAISTDGVESWRHWFSQRVGWYYGLLKVYSERWPAIWAVARRSPFAMYNYVGYLGVLTLVFHVARVAGVVLLALAMGDGLADLFGVNSSLHFALASPVALAIAVASYLALGLAALVTIVPRAERGYVAPIVPLYLLYALAHVVPMTIGFANWISLRYRGRRLYRDHYEPDGAGASEPCIPRIVGRPA
jgi:cellulose synthase/poly-beta-1,6-N-acetylglucosamine synthase-like glycosyltransferase